MDRIDRELKTYLETARGLLPARDRLDAYPDVEDYRLFVEGKLEGAPLERMLKHLSSDAAAQEIVRGARALLDSAGSETEAVPAGLEARAKALVKGGGPSVRCPHCGQGITPFKKPLSLQRAWSWAWAAAAALSFALSFAFPARFMQFLVLTLLFGVKWVVDLRAQKTQILVYKALAAEDVPRHEHLHRTSSHL